MTHYLGVAAADGIAPLFPALQAMLAEEPASHVTLVYGVENSAAVRMREELLRLKDRYLDRLALIFVMSRERQDVDVLNGRIDRAKVEQLLQRWIDVGSVDGALISGPEAMIGEVRSALEAAGVDARRIRDGGDGERSGRPFDFVHGDMGTAIADGQTLIAHPQTPSADQQPLISHQQTLVSDPPTLVGDGVVRVALTFEGKRFVFEMPREGEAILDAALREGIDVPYSCRSGVCGTCRATLTAGKVDLDVNYALEDDQIERGAILMCQSYPRTAQVALDVREF